MGRLLFFNDSFSYSLVRFLANWQSISVPQATKSKLLFMQIPPTLALKSREYSKKAGLVLAAVTALYLGLGSPSPAAHKQVAPMAMEAFLNQSAGDSREVTRTASLEIVVAKPADVAEKIRQLAESNQGFLVNSEINGGSDARTASLTIRIPVAKFQEVKKAIIQMALRVESDKLQAQDVTKEYVDQQQRLQNLKAQEEQYLAILKRASNVKDTLEVSEKINEVQSQIEQQQAEFSALSKQVETVAVGVTLRAEEEAQIFGLHWRPLYQLKNAMRDGIEGIGDYASSMASLFFYLPAIFLWLVTILVGAALGWRILRWSGRLLFGSSKTASQEKV